MSWASSNLLRSHSLRDVLILQTLSILLFLYSLVILEVPYCLLAVVILRQLDSKQLSGFFLDSPASQRLHDAPDAD